MGTPVHNINEILLKVVLNTISLTINTNLATMQFERVNYFKKNPSFQVSTISHHGNMSFLRVVPTIM
jgi:hypothetical protein